MLLQPLSPSPSFVRPSLRPAGRDIATTTPRSLVRSLDEHLERAQLRGIEAKDHLFTEGDDRSHIYRVELGAICLYKVTADGRRQVLGFAFAGDLIGLGTSSAHQFNAQATKSSRVRALAWNSVMQIARQDPSLGIKLYEVISEELAAARDLLLTTGQRTAMERVAAFLLAMSRRNGRRGQEYRLIELPMTRSDIGDFLGLTIETVSRTFTKLRHLGVIDLLQSASVLLLDIPALENLASGERQ